ncbi:Protein CBG24536, partial [Caenorhabditis briggsae]
IEQPVVVVDDHHHHHGKLSNNNRDELLGEEVEVQKLFISSIFSVTGDVIFNDEDGGAEMQRMVEIMEKKKKENGQRLMDLLARMHRFNDYCKKEGWLSTNSEIQELLQIGAILETSIQ